MKVIKLTVISAPNIICPIVGRPPRFQGKNGEWTLVCGRCETILAEKIHHEQLMNLILRCACGAENKVPVSWKFHLDDIIEKWNVPVLIIALLLLVGSTFIQTYGGIAFWIGLFISLISAILLLMPKKTRKIFTE